MAKISITRALVELKRLDDRISREIDTGIYVGTSVGQDQHRKITNFASPEKAQEKINASFQSVERLIRNRKALKKAITRSNALTEITLGDEVLTVAEAIDRKAVVEFQKRYRAVLQTQLSRSRQLVEHGNSTLEQTIQTAVNQVLGGDKKVVDKAMLDMIAASHKAQSERALFGESRVVAAIAELDAAIDKVESELDFALSESNAVTQIDIDL